MDIKTTKLETSTTKDIKQVGKVLTGKTSSRQDVLDEAKRLLHDNGLSPEYIIKYYKDILEAKETKYKYRGTDILKVLELLSVILGIVPKGKDVLYEEDKITELLHGKSNDEVRAFIVQTTKQTIAYIKRGKDNATPLK